MYWNNPLIETRWPASIDPVVDGMHNGVHCLFYNPVATFENVKTQQTLDDLSTWASEWLTKDGIDEFVADKRNHYDIANLVKLNMWIHDIRRQGIVKPWLMLDQGDGSFIAGTGDSRLRCLERIPEISTVPAFISTTEQRRGLYKDLEEIKTFDQFANICKARFNKMFLFRLTDARAPYGMYWYEYDSDLTRAVTPGESDAVAMFTKYYKKNTPVKITPEWFDNVIDWNSYTE
jgi:hypothetical protein